MTVDADEFIENTLAHWGYDPRKAHEYYMKTRQLVSRAKSHVDLNPFNNKSNKSVDKDFEAAKRALPKHGTMRFDPKARLDTSQVDDKREERSDPGAGQAQKRDKPREESCRGPSKSRSHWRNSRQSSCSAKKDSFV